MKRFLSILAVSLAVFAAACAVSYIFRSDGFGVPGAVMDGNRRLGFPLVIWSQGGWITSRIFSLTALMVDLVVAFVVGVLISLLYAKAKHGSLA